jgi:homospermidine synthase
MDLLVKYKEKSIISEFLAVGDKNEVAYYVPTIHYLHCYRLVLETQ